MNPQKITAIFLAVVLVTGAITLGTSVLVDDVYASEDKYKNKKHDRGYDSYDKMTKDKKHDRGYDSYDKEPKNKKQNTYKVELPKDKNFIIVLNNTLYNNWESTEIVEDKDDKKSYETSDYAADKNSYASTDYADDKNSYEMDRSTQSYGNDNYQSTEYTDDKNSYETADYADKNSYEPKHIEYNNEYEYNPVDYK